MVVRYDLKMIITFAPGASIMKEPIGKKLVAHNKTGLWLKSYLHTHTHINNHNYWQTHLQQIQSSTQSSVGLLNGWSICLIKSHFTSMK
jgi:hypothetical protein